MTTKREEAALDEWWELDRRHYLEYWTPDKSGHQMLMELLDEDPIRYATIMGYGTLSKVSEKTGIKLDELMKRDATVGESLICTKCQALTPRLPELETKTCPVCRTGTLQYRTREWIEDHWNELKKAWKK